VRLHVEHPFLGAGQLSRSRSASSASTPRARPSGRS
jgi:hypothetical protein